MSDQEVAYCITVGDSHYYHHASCLLACFRQNPNTLTEEKQADHWEHYTPVPLKDIPEDARCCIPGCWVPIKQEKNDETL